MTPRCAILGLSWCIFKLPWGNHGAVFGNPGSYRCLWGHGPSWHKVQLRVPLGSHKRRWSRKQRVGTSMTGRIPQGVSRRQSAARFEIFVGSFGDQIRPRMVSPRGLGGVLEPSFFGVPSWSPGLLGAFQVLSSDPLGASWPATRVGTTRAPPRPKNGENHNPGRGGGEANGRGSQPGGRSAF